MKKYLIVALVIAFLPIKALAIEVSRLQMASTVRIEAEFSSELIDKKVAEMFDSVDSVEARQYRQDLTELSIGGSGVMLTYDGCVATSRHVLVNSDYNLPYQKPILYYGAGLKIEPQAIGELEIVFVSQEMDLAVACLKDPQGKFFHPADFVVDKKVGALFLGEQIYALGFPSFASEFVKLTIGIVSGYMKDNPLVLTSALFSPGMSGGPVYNSANKVVSLVTGYITDYSFGAILDAEKFDSWPDEFFKAIEKNYPDTFVNCSERQDNFYEKDGVIYYDANCKTERNPGLDDEIVNNYKNICGRQAVLDGHFRREAAQYIASGKTNLVEWQKYLEWLCWQE
jgi:hypothetical protein